MRKHISTGIVVILTLIASAALARSHRSWSYGQLMEASDLVVVATATNSVDSGELDTNSWSGVRFIGVNTDFDVHLVLKGTTNRSGITVFHLRHASEQRGGMDNGAMLVKFITKPLGKYSAQPDYLLFLKQRSDGRYEPTSGHIDPIDSVWRMDGKFENFELKVIREIEKAQEVEAQHPPGN
jgi:hypothetical protein